jgi:alkylation response protein AidB-like acyl-CoA dehydrogenase
MSWTRPHYRALVQAGLLRRLIPPPLGGEMTSLVDLAIEAEERMAVETSVPRSVSSTGLGLMPLLFSMSNTVALANPSPSPVDGARTRSAAGLHG